MLSKVVEDICVTNEFFLKIFQLCIMISIFTSNRRGIQSIIFVQAVLHESSLLKENLTALKEEAEVDFFFL